MSSFDTSRRAKENPAGSSSAGYLVKDVLLTVKTQPLPSNKYDESVCGAGITADGEWIRIYPFEWFGMPEDMRPLKYQWIRIPVKKRDPQQDHRPESYKPNLSAMQVGQHVGTGRSWQERNKIVMPMVGKSVEAMLKSGRSLDLIKPKQVIDLVVERSEDTWGDKRDASMKQQRLFGKQRVVLEKVPWKFSYKFICNDSSCKGHKLTILDWEIFELYKRLVKDYGYAMDTVMKELHKRWLDQMWGGRRDSYLYIGTVQHKRFNSPVVLGVYWPPKDPKANQTKLL